MSVFSMVAVLTWGFFFNRSFDSTNRMLSPVGYYNQPLAANGNRREETASKKNYHGQRK